MNADSHGPARADITAPGMAPSQQRILELLKRAGGAAIPELATGVGLNIETVRHHLRALEALGYVARRGTRVVGPGRPEVVYALAPEAEKLFPRREGAVLKALAAHLKETGNESLLEAFFDSYIGERRADALARVDGLSGTARVEEVARILSELGFMAEVELGRGRPRLHLCHCPLRELVEVSRVPCRAELGFIRELLGDPLTRLAYIPSGDASCSYRTRTA
ncbi:MAG TPA: winged helix-turn-helix transcriptional regulator [Longimicrobiales bacterium]|nr:winged helix-turn-helix transcriptional regulator [Longimicrobiales bacterium]